MSFRTKVYPKQYAGNSHSESQSPFGFDVLSDQKPVAASSRGTAKTSQSPFGFDVLSDSTGAPMYIDKAGQQSQSPFGFDVLSDAQGIVASVAEYCILVTIAFRL